MGSLGEDLATKLRRVLYQNQVELEPAAPPQQEQWYQQPDSQEPTLAYISKMLLDDDSDEEEQALQQKPYQGLLDELTAIVSPKTLSPVPRYDNSDIATHAVVNSGGDRDLYWSLMQCARAVAANNAPAFYEIVRQLNLTPLLELSASEKVALYIIDALMARLAGAGPQAHRALAAGISTRRLLNVRLLNLPSSTVSQVFANENILRACRGARTVHIVDYGIHCGFQWPCLIKAFSQRPEGPPLLKITGIDFSDVVNSSQTHQRLLAFAESHGVQLEYCSVASTSWELVQPVYHPNEVLIVNCNVRLRDLKDDMVSGNSPRRMFYERIYKMKPKLFVQCAVSAGLSSPFFLPRFEEALHHYFAKMEYIYAWLEDNLEEREFMEKIIARSIMNVVACDGLEQTERPDKYRSWASRTKRAGFQALPLDDEICGKVTGLWGRFKLNKNFSCGKDENWLLVGWKDRVILAMSAWTATRNGGSL